MASASIDLRSAEDVSDVLNVTFRLIRARWRIFLKSIFYLGGPPLILGIGSLGATGLAVMYGGTDPGLGLAGRLIAGFSVSGLLMLVGTALSITGTLAVVRLYVEGDGAPFDVGEVWSVAKGSVLGVIGLQMLNGLAVVVLFPIAIIPCLGALAWLAWMLFVTVRYFFLAIPLRVIEGPSAFQAVSRAGSLVKNYFWDTLGVFMVIYVVQSILSTVFVLPFQVLVMSGNLHNLDVQSLPSWMLAGLGGLFLLAMTGSILTTGVMYIAGAVQAFTLKDRKEEAGVEARVSQLEQEAAESAEGKAGSSDGDHQVEENEDGSVSTDPGDSFSADDDR